MRTGESAMIGTSGRSREARTPVEPGRRVADDRGEPERLGDLARRRGDRVGAGRFRLGALRVDDGGEELVLLHRLGDAVHRLDRLDRIFAGRRFGREHDGVGALEDGDGDVRHLGARRHRRRDHALQHLRRDHRPACRARRAARVNLLLHAGHRLERHLHAEIAARHHDGVRQLHDLVEPLQRLRLLDLGHDAGAALHDLAGLGDVLGALDEGERHPVDVRREHGVEVAPVLVGERARAEHRVGQADALAVGELSALHDLGHGAAAVRLHRPSGARARRRGARRGPGSSAARISGCGSCTRSRLPGVASLSRTKVWPVLQRRPSSPSKLPIRSFGPCRSARMPIGRSCFGLDLADGLDEPPHRVVRRVAHVDAENVGAGLEELVDCFRCVGGRSEGCEDLDLAPASHRPPTPRLVGSVSWIVQLS